MINWAGEEREVNGHKGGCRGSSESTHVKMPHFWKSHVTAQILIISVSFQRSAFFTNDDNKTTDVVI